MRCSFCEKKATYSLDVVLLDGDVREIKACDDCFFIGVIEQEKILLGQKMIDDMRRFGSRVEKPSEQA